MKDGKIIENSMKTESWFSATKLINLEPESLRKKKKGEKIQTANFRDGRGESV